MKKQQIILTLSGVVILFSLFFFGRTVPAKKDNAPVVQDGHSHSFNEEAILAAIKDRLSPAQQAYIQSLQSSVVRGDVKDQQTHVYHQLAKFFTDSVQVAELRAYYAGEAAKLENSEKSLTFAARLFLDNLRGVSNAEAREWMAEQGRELFEKALIINPANDSAKIGLGSCFIYGAHADDQQQVMQGIQKILEVVRKDSTNMYAQMMLGIGGVVSGQYDKATERLLKVVNAEPENVEAFLTLAEAYERKGDKQNAVKWYRASKKFAEKSPEFMKELDNRIKSLQQ